MKKLREGFTTGSCAAAAALACCMWIRDGKCPDAVEIIIPEGRCFHPEIIPHADGTCGVIKDAGDDPDITNGMEICANVRLLEANGAVRFCAGMGVGTITEAGLKLPVGEAAINPVPRKMIEKAVRSVFGERGAEVTISIPGGETIARKTFNPRLGIRNGLSVLGTSGIVRPMSEDALKESLLAELKMRVCQGERDFIFTFGNQGEAALQRLYPEKRVIQVSNYLGFMLDSALELGVSSLLIGGHPGKMAKVAAGVMQTHSRTADARRETIVAHLAMMGANGDILRSVYNCTTTDAAIALIHRAGLDDAWNRMALAAKYYCSLRVNGEIGIETVFVDAQGNRIGESEATE